MESLIPINNGRYLSLSIEKSVDKYPTKLSFRILDEHSNYEDGTLTVRESEIVSLYNLIKYCYRHGISVERMLVDSNIFDEIDRISKKEKEEN